MISFKWHTRNVQRSYQRSLYMKWSLRKSNYKHWSYLKFYIHILSYNLLVALLNATEKNFTDNRDSFSDVCIQICKDCTCIFCNCKFQFAFYSGIQKRQINTRGIWGTFYVREASECRYQNLSIHINLYPPLFCFYSLITLILLIWVGSISKDSWRSGEERPLWETRGWL